MDEQDPMSSEVLTQAEVERLLAQVTEEATSAVVHQDGGVQVSKPLDSIQPYDFRNPVFLSPAELRKLRVRHEEFIEALTARLSIYLRTEFTLQMSQLQTVTYQKFTESLPSQAHLTMFKVEPLRGISVLDINPRLGLTIVDRLMGGPGHSVNLSRDLSEIEVALLDQVVAILLGEWCRLWTKIQDLRPVLLGHENSARFLQTSQQDAVMLTLAMEARLGDCLETIQIGFPYQTLEPLIRKVNKAMEDNAEEDRSQKAAGLKWHRDLDEVKVPVTAEWPKLKMNLRDLGNMSVGDFIPLDDSFAQTIQLRLAKISKFSGRLGTLNDRWAVEITEAIKK